MPPAHRQALKAGDEVQVFGKDAFNLEWLKDARPRDWNHAKYTGTVVGKDGAKWKGKGLPGVFVS